MNGKTRSLKIEATGDFGRRKIKPRIRLMGHWLERAGFKPGDHVSVHYVSAGVIELRSDYALSTLNEATTGAVT